MRLPYFFLKPGLGCSATLRISGYKTAPQNGHESKLNLQVRATARAESKHWVLAELVA